jgi:hypothetical protein
MLDGREAARAITSGRICRLGRQQFRLVGRGRDQVLLDGDEFPTICGTGTEDYFCGAYNFDAGTVDPTFPRAYVEFTSPYSRHAASHPSRTGPIKSQQRFGLYRWHIMDPIRFESDLRSRCRRSAGGRRRIKRRYLPLQDDIASVAYWYQTLPPRPSPALPGRDSRASKSSRAGMTASCEPCPPTISSAPTPPCSAS